MDTPQLVAAEAFLFFLFSLIANALCILWTSVSIGRADQGAFLPVKWVARPEGAPNRVQSSIPDSALADSSRMTLSDAQTGGIFPAARRRSSATKYHPTLGYSATATLVTERYASYASHASNKTVYAVLRVQSMVFFATDLIHIVLFFGAFSSSSSGSTASLIVQIAAMHIMEHFGLLTHVFLGILLAGVYRQVFILAGTTKKGNTAAMFQSTLAEAILPPRAQHEFNTNVSLLRKPETAQRPTKEADEYRMWLGMPHVLVNVPRPSPFAQYALPIAGYWLEMIRRGLLWACLAGAIGIESKFILNVFTLTTAELTDNSINSVLNLTFRSWVLLVGIPNMLMTAYAGVSIATLKRAIKFPTFTHAMLIMGHLQMGENYMIQSIFVQGLGVIVSWLVPAAFGIAFHGFLVRIVLGWQIALFSCLVKLSTHLPVLQLGIRQEIRPALDIFQVAKEQLGSTVRRLSNIGRPAIITATQNVQTESDQAHSQGSTNSLSTNMRRYTTAPRYMTADMFDRIGAEEKTTSQRHCPSPPGELLLERRSCNLPQCMSANSLQSSSVAHIAVTARTPCAKTSASAAASSHDPPQLFSQQTNAPLSDFGGSAVKPAQGAGMGSVNWEDALSSSSLDEQGHSISAWVEAAGRPRDNLGPRPS